MNKITYMEIARYGNENANFLSCWVFRGEKAQNYATANNHRAARILSLFLAYLRKCGNFPR